VTASRPFADCAEPVIGRAFGATRWLHRGYALATSADTMNCGVSAWQPMSAIHVRSPALFGLDSDMAQCRRSAIFCREQAQQKWELFDHLIGGSEQRWRYGKAERPSSPQVDDQFEFSRHLDWKVGRL